MSNIRTTPGVGLYVSNIVPNLSAALPTGCPKNAVILIPIDSSSSISSSEVKEEKSGKREYKAYVVTNGEWSKSKDKQALKEVNIGSHTFNLNEGQIVDENFLSFPVTTERFNNIVKIAFAKAGAIIPMGNPFLDQADDTQFEQYSNLALPDKKNLTETAHYPHTLFQAQFTADALVDSAFNGNEGKVKKGVQQIVAQNKSDLLFQEGSTVNAHGQEIKGISAFKVALTADDYDMLEVMFPCIEKNIEAAIQQYCEVFPEARDYFEEKEEKTRKSPTIEKKEEKEQQIGFNYGEFKNIVEAITNDDFENPIPCHVLAVEIPPQGVKDLPSGIQAAFIRSGERLFYINRETNEYHEYDQIDKQRKAQILEDFDQEMKPGKEPRLLSPHDLDEIVENNIGLIHESMNLETAKALREFREKLKPQDTLRHGKNLNFIAEMLMDAYKVNEYYYAQGQGWAEEHSEHPWEQEQFSLFARCIIGGLQRYLPAPYMRAIYTGVGKMMSENSALVRHDKLYFTDRTAISHASSSHTFHSRTSSSLGFSNFLYSEIRAAFVAVRHNGAQSSMRPGWSFNDLCNKKSDSYCPQFKKRLKSLAQNLMEMKKLDK